MKIKRFDVYMATLNPTVGYEIKKTRPCLIISPGEMNIYIRTVITATMTTTGKDSPTRVACHFKNKKARLF